MAIVAPVLIVLGLIVYNLMLFSSAVACFDRAAPDLVLAHGVSPAGEGGQLGASAACEQVQAALQEALAGYNVDIEVSAQGGGSTDTAAQLSFVGQPRSFACTMRFHPWPSGLSIAGVNFGAPAFLQHTRTVTVDPWRPGVVV